MWGREAAGQITRADINNSRRVGYCAVQVISGNFLLCEVIANCFQETSPCAFQ